MTDPIFLDDADAFETRRRAAETLLKGTMEAVALLRSIVGNDLHCAECGGAISDLREARQAATTLLNMAGLGDGVPQGSGQAQKPAQVANLLDLLTGSQTPREADPWPRVHPDAIMPEHRPEEGARCANCGWWGRDHSHRYGGDLICVHDHRKHGCGFSHVYGAPCGKPERREYMPISQRKYWEQIV